LKIAAEDSGRALVALNHCPPRLLGPTFANPGLFPEAAPGSSRRPGCVRGAF